MGMMYAWASPDYMLDHMSLDMILMYYDYGNGIMTGRPAGPLKNMPDLAAFNRYYGNMIKRPGSGVK
jgi:hypothetical protein